MQVTLREPGSAITHFVAMCFAMGAGIPLLIKAAACGTIYLVAMFIFIASMILLYGASATYHSLTLPDPVIKIFRKIDHSMIFVLIAGSYTPICLIVLGGKQGYTLLAIVWGIALLGIGIKIMWITCPKWFSSILYIAMGWICVFYLSSIVDIVTPAAFAWLLIGGIVYTIGGIIYALKLPLFNTRHENFGSHEIFHLFVMGGSFCHFIFMYQYVIGM